MNRDASPRDRLRELLEDSLDCVATGYRRPREAIPRQEEEHIPEERAHRLEQLAETIRACKKCPLSAGRQQAVPGIGAIDPLTMVIGEAPGADEDRLGEPFVGKSGKYLDKWLHSIGLSRQSNTYIANIVKCRPPNNRDPESIEVERCAPYLDEQIKLIRPKTILLLGLVAAHRLLNCGDPLKALRCREHQYQGIPTVATYHPSAVLRNPHWRQPVWDDLRKLRAIIDR